jgi:glycine C-acetyltransferase/8-amino-7-oxononanoate synthase
MLAGEMIEIEARLSELKVLGLDRRTRLVSGPQGPHVLVDGQPVLLLCSDNYLGFADHPRVREAAADAALRWGVGAGASRLGPGTMTIHRRLEERLASVHGRENALLFGSRYLANAGTLAALARPGDVVFCDAHNHASILDGCRLSDSEVFVYDHCDLEHLQWGIGHAEGRGVLIVTESVFSLDGDVAPLAAIVELAQRFELRTFVDESHGLGTLGPAGRGALAEAGLEDQVDVVAGSLGTALGSHGGYVACDQLMWRYLINAVPTLVFDTAPAPPSVAGALAALDLLAERPRRVEKLAANAEALRAGLRAEGLDLVPSRTPIVTLAIGDVQRAAGICRAALTRGVFVETVLPPAVAPLDSRVRLTVMTGHREDELLSAARMLGAAARPAEQRPAAAAMDVAAPEGPEPGPPPSPGVFDFEAPEPVRRAA